MTLSIISNYAASVAHRNLRQSDSGLSVALAKLAAGRRVLSAKDDAAALAIGSRLGAEVSGLQQAQSNAGQAGSMLQVADGGMARIDDVLTQMKSLAVQASSGQLSAGDRAALNTEFQSLSSEVDRVSASTDFGGTKLLDGSAGTTSVKVGTGATASDDIAVALGSTSTTALSINGADITSQANADAANTAIGNAIDRIQTLRAGIGASENRLDYAASNVSTTIENTEAARSSLMDLDVASEASNLANKKILTQAGIAMQKQANQQPKSLLKLFV